LSAGKSLSIDVLPIRSSRKDKPIRGLALEQLAKRDLPVTGAGNQVAKSIHF
jgi:hypothetical protein